VIRLTNAEVLTFLKASEGLIDVELDNERGDIAAQLHAACGVKQVAIQYRMKALEKERARLLNDLAKKDAKGNICYGESPDGKPATRPVIFKNQKAADAAFGAWQKKVEEVETVVVELNLTPVRDDFFAKPEEVLVKHGVRIGFLPVMVKHQAALKANAPKNGKK
jgi:hypothetical protein